MKARSAILAGMGPVLLASQLNAATLQGSPEAGMAVAASCAACHQSDGNGLNNPQGESWPRLAGLNAGYISKQLHDFKAGSRQNPSMAAFASMLNDQQIADVAAWYASQPAAQPAQLTLNDEQQALGKRLVRRGDWDREIPSCNSCHGPDSAGVGSNFPALAGQHAGYIVQQLQAWQQGSRRNDPDNLMVAVAERMTDADIQAVALWLSQQPVK